jgi:hypothetical protein
MVHRIPYRFRFHWCRTVADASETSKLCIPRGGVHGCRQLSVFRALFPNSYTTPADSLLFSHFSLHRASEMATDNARDDAQDDGICLPRIYGSCICLRRVSMVFEGSSSSLISNPALTPKRLGLTGPNVRPTILNSFLTHDTLTLSLATCSDLLLTIINRFI